MTSKSHGERLGGRETGRKGGKEGRKEGGREGAPRVTSSATLVHTLMRAYNVHAENGSGAAATFRTHCLFMNQQHKKKISRIPGSIQISGTQSRCEMRFSKDVR